mgnify:FL=1
MILLSFQILNTKVIFNAKKTKGDSDVTGDLTFNQVDINIGAAFDGTAFKVPISGIYKLSFSGQSASGKISYSQITVYCKAFYGFGYINVPQLAINDGNDAEKGDGNNLSYTWMINLVQGDELTLKSTNYLHASSLYPLTFTGELIHIEN